MMEDKLQLESTQNLPARAIDPLKLIGLLRSQFGLGRYEISVGRLSNPSKKEDKRHVRADTLVDDQKLLQHPHP